MKNFAFFVVLLSLAYLVSVVEAKPSLSEPSAADGESSPGSADEEPPFEKREEELPASVGRVGLRRDRNQLSNLVNGMNLSDVGFLVPAEERRFFNQLTAEDKEVLKRVLVKSTSFSYSNVSEVLHDLRNGSTTLYQKAIELVTGIRQTIAKLSPPARAFVDEIAEKAQSAIGGGELTLQNLKAQAAGVVERFRALDESTKEELKRAFPVVTAVVYNPTFQLLASGLLGIQQQQNN